jgi:hypothetical protein
MHFRGTDMSARNEGRQNVSVSLTRQILKKGGILAAKCETSISGLLAQEIEPPVAEEGAYESAERQALALLDEGFHMGGTNAGRDELHER